MRFVKKYEKRIKKQFDNFNSINNGNLIFIYIKRKLIEKIILPYF